VSECEREREREGGREKERRRERKRGPLIFNIDNYFLKM
jgi:hypothetical protein